MQPGPLWRIRWVARTAQAAGEIERVLLLIVVHNPALSRPDQRLFPLHETSKGEFSPQERTGIDSRICTSDRKLLVRIDFQYPQRNGLIRHRSRYACIQPREIRAAPGDNLSDGSGGECAA